MEACANCERDIGNLEQKFTHQDKIICFDCKELLSNQEHDSPSIVVDKGQVTIEKTAKKWKLLQLIGAIMIVFGLLGSCSYANTDTSSNSLIFALIGFVIYICARIYAWWYHG